MNFNRKITHFTLDAEVDAYGVKGVCDAFNELHDKLQEAMDLISESGRYPSNRGDDFHQRCARFLINNGRLI